MSQNKENAKKKSRCNVKDCKRNPNVSLHRLPNEKYFERRQKWIEALQLAPDVRGSFFVCSEHFVQKDFRQGITQISLHYSAIPRVNLPSIKPAAVKKCLVEPSVCESSFADEGVFLEMSGNDVSSLLSSTFEESTESINESDELIIYIDSDCEDEFLTEQENHASNVTYHDQSTQTHQKYADKLIQANLAYDELVKPWTLLDILRTDSDLQSWTGIQRFVTVNNIVDCIMRLESAQDQLSKFKASPKVLTIFVMVKLKTNLTFKQLSCLFAITPETLRHYFEKFLPILKAVLEPAVFWPTKEQVYNNLPKCFKPQFEDCFVVMDCTEMPIERLKSLESRIKTYSHYKGGHTGKINITSVPSGLIANVSRAYGGKASDKYIILKEKVIEKLSAGNAVMVDKGYDIQKETSAKGIKLYRPPILDKSQHTKEEAIYNTNVATSRIHVERVIQRLKIFNIFREKMNKSMLKHVDDIVFVTCAITNLNSPVLANDKF